MKNKNGEDIINLSAFYANFKDFVYDIADNALKRVLREDLEQKFGKFEVINHFKPKVYEPFYNSNTNSLTILLKCSPEDENLKIKNYQFQSIIGNPFGDVDQILVDRIAGLVNDSQKLVSIFVENPLNAAPPEIAKIYANHTDVAGKEKAHFYNEMISVALPESKEFYYKTIDKVQDKETILEGANELITLIAAQQCKDARNCNEKLFHIFPLIRDIWRTIISKVDDTK